MTRAGGRATVGAPPTRGGVDPPAAVAAVCTAAMPGLVAALRGNLPTQRSAFAAAYADYMDDHGGVAGGRAGGGGRPAPSQMLYVLRSAGLLWVAKSGAIGWYPAAVDALLRRRPRSSPGGSGRPGTKKCYVDK